MIQNNYLYSIQIWSGKHRRLLKAYHVECRGKVLNKNNK